MVEDGFTVVALAEFVTVTVTVIVVYRRGIN
jgi:hypothetical protein